MNRNIIAMTMTMPTPSLKRVVQLAQKAGVLRTRDAALHSIPRQYLTRAYRRGLIKRVGRGLYIAADAQLSESHSLAQAAKRVPNGVICLLSALQFHDLTTQSPFEIWMAIDRKAWLPHVPDLPLRFVRFSGPALTEEVQTHRVGGVAVRVYSPAKTVADCFKYRNKIGLDVALEALRDCWRQRKATMDQLWRAAKICRVANVMRPYMESLT